MPTIKIDSYIGFAVRCGRVSFGLEMLLRAKRPPFVVLYDAALGANSYKNLKYYCVKNKVKAVKLEENHLNDALQRQNVKIISISDESLAKAIIANSEITVFEETHIEEEE